MARKKSSHVVVPRGLFEALQDAAHYLTLEQYGELTDMDNINMTLAEIESYGDKPERAFNGGGRRQR